MHSTKWEIGELPYPDWDIETKRILKALPSAHAALAELKGIADSIPNQAILINTLSLQEAKDSSAIENIITTHDDLYRQSLEEEKIYAISAKEVQNYIFALKKGYESVKKKGVLTTSSILQIQELVEENKAGLRKLPGTDLRNHLTGKVVYTPPQHPEDIVRLMSNLEKYINDPSIHECDALIKMALIHFQFESIHPFYDGNGRTGRIINILYLVLEGLQDLPILYLSSYIIRNKRMYYQHLQDVRDHQEWENWILFLVKGVEETAKETIFLVRAIKELMHRNKHFLRNHYKFYSQDLLNHLFKHPYTKIEFLAKDLGVSRLTASSYLNKMAEDGLLEKRKLGRGNFYIHHELMRTLSQR
jgi:Fic family protein